MIKTSNFLAVARDQYQYLFFLVADKYWLARSEGREVSAVLEDVFAQDIGERAVVVQSFFENRSRNHALILSKPWPDEIAQLLNGPSGPILLVMSSDFMSFDPRQDDYALILVGMDVEEIINNLRLLAGYIRKGEELFAILRRQGTGETTWRRFVRASELRPGAFGFAIDLRQFIVAMGGQDPSRRLSVHTSQPRDPSNKKTRKR